MAQGVRSLASPQHSILYGAGTALHTGRVQPNTQDSVALAGRRSTMDFLVPNRARL